MSAIVAALVVPVGFALSPGDSIGRRESGADVRSDSTSAVATSGLLVHDAGDVTSRLLPVPDPAKLFLVGSVLFGLAAVVRRAV